ncbi:Leucine-rich repeat receptor-like protein kinase family protein [Theobroma cacao]|uniref:non-specific serine/threonine protein kinase n=1 Tax=Theobroma cacao TaxID=3641 RepID=A0A061DNR8_THECC|nr:Leucine-rich repeat receptor-like protein kinase family protein [Theobroma cacao]
MSLSKLTKISELGLSNNSLSGQILPSLITNWTNLISLQLQYNSFTGKIPPELGLLTKLNYLFLLNNKLSGLIPTEIGNLENLIMLSLSTNQLSGSIPPTIWNLKNPELLQLFANNLNGTIPPEIGRIPRDFGRYIPRLAYVSFSNNSFSGELPPELCSGFALEYFSVNGKNFSGPLPACLRSCSGLNRVRLDGNRFSGDITNAFGVHPNLEYITLSDNQFISEISPEWGECKSLTNLQMDRKRISREIPAELGNLTLLRVLTLSSNELVGNISTELGNLKMLFNINLSQNHLSGQIPQSIGNLVDLQYLDLSKNSLTGIAPEELKYCDKLLSLSLSHSNLSGAIARGLGSLIFLQYSLDLSSNSFSGKISPELGKLVSLENLNVSGNDLSGEIPTTLPGMISLHSFDFSYNELTGPIPTDGPFQKAPSEAFAGNSGLCVYVDGLPPCNSISTSKRFRMRTVKVVVVVLSVFGVLALIAAAVFARHRLRNQPGGEAEGSEFEGSESIWFRGKNFKFSDIVKSTEDFNEKYCIGKGGFRSVYEALLPTGQIVAVKKLNISDSSGILVTNRQSFENEIRLLTEVRHRNIIKLYGFCSHRGLIYLVYEYMERGSLKSVLHGAEGEVELGWATRTYLRVTFCWKQDLNQNSQILALQDCWILIHPIGHQLQDIFATWLQLWSSDIGVYDGKASRGTLESPIIINSVSRKYRSVVEGFARPTTASSHRPNSRGSCVCSDYGLSMHKYQGRVKTHHAFCGRRTISKNTGFRG